MADGPQREADGLTLLPTSTPDNKRSARCVCTEQARGRREPLTGGTCSHAGGITWAGRAAGRHLQCVPVGSPNSSPEQEPSSNFLFLCHHFLIPILLLGPRDGSMSGDGRSYRRKPDEKDPTETRNRCGESGTQPHRSRGLGEREPRGSVNPTQSGCVNPEFRTLHAEPSINSSIANRPKATSTRLQSDCNVCRNGVVAPKSRLG